MRSKRKTLAQWQTRAHAKRCVATRRWAFAQACATGLWRARGRWVGARVLEEWRALAEEAREVVAELEKIAELLLQRRLLYCKRHVLQEWRHEMTMRAANELMLAKRTAMLCEAVGCWCLLLADAPILYPQQWQQAVARDTQRRLRVALLAWQFVEYQQQRMEEELFAQHGKRWQERCWKRWVRVHGAIHELRERDWDLESRRRQIWAKTRARIIGDSLQRWCVAARQLCEERQRVVLGQRWQQRVVASALRFWRQRVAWWAHPSVLNRRVFSAPCVCWLDVCGSFGVKCVCCVCVCVCVCICVCVYVGVRDDAEEAFSLSLSLSLSRARACCVQCIHSLHTLHARIARPMARMG